MAYTIVNKFIPTSKYGRKAPYNMEPQTITFHNTANDATALGEVSYMTSNNNQTSYHVAIDDKHVVQAIPFNRTAWHAGDGQGAGNRKSIGIEVCYSKSGGPKYVAAEENAVVYIAHLLKERGWGIDRVKWHRDWSGKNCPHRVFAEGRAASVRNRIAAKLAELKGGAVVPAVNPTAPARDYVMEGDEGAAVRAMQADLNKAGAKPQLTVDGIFGKASTSAVKAFQAKHKLTVDGIYGAGSKAKMSAVLTPKPAVQPAAKPKEDKPMAADQYEKNAKASASLAEGQRWAVAEGITDGTYPERPLTRAEFWETLRRLHEKK